MKEFMHIGESINVEGVPNQVSKAMEEQLSILDGEYGKDRDKFESDGGYVVFVETEDDISILDERHNLEFFGSSFFIPEYIELIETDGGDYLSILFLLNNDYGLCVYIKKELLPEDSYYVNNIDSTYTPFDVEEEV
jgi:hypothetical protein